jgi:mannose-6-phosphate isomerase-like protein (cupin superfamily)
MASEKAYIDSGILELYVLGCLSEELSRDVELMAAADPAVRQEISKIEETMEAFAMEHAVAPNPVVKPFLLATIDYTERLKNGEPVTYPPLLHEKSVIDDYALWLNRDDMVYTGEEDIYAKIIGYTPGAISAIIWIRNQTPPEIHHDEFEKFLVVEGSCNITVGNAVHELVPGDYFMIPLHKDHVVEATSKNACKIILQRIAA